VAARFSPEDLMRAFDVLTKGEYEIRSSMQPRFHLEMTLLRWMHLGKLVPLGDLIQALEKEGPRPAAPAARAVAPPDRRERPRPATAAPVASRPRDVETKAALPAVEPVPPDRFKDAFLAEVRKLKKFFYGTVVAQAQRIEVEGDRVVFTFAPQHRALRAQLEQTRPLLETTATQLAGRTMAIVAAEGVPAAAPAGPGDGTAAGEDEKRAALREQALADSGVQAMLDVFAAEIKDVEEM
jgi:DNA polymerase III subunit gamma/tau